MRLPKLWLVLLALAWPMLAQAHVGSPDVFYDGMVGAWPAHITIRMPSVVPGRAEIIAQVQSAQPVEVSFTPLSSRIAVKNAPPAELARPAYGETNVYTGELWLMTFGAYSIKVNIHGPAGDGSVLIPVNSVATAQLPLPPWLGGILLVLGLVLLGGAMAVVGAAAGESILPPEGVPGKRERRKFWIAASVTGLVLVLGLYGGNRWWKASEQEFRSRLHAGGWPELATEISVAGSQRILHLTLGKKAFGIDGQQPSLDLARDHGKLLHLFLAGQNGERAFGHLHPVRKGNRAFDVVLPPLPAGDYAVFCDLTLASGLSSTATNTIQLPPVPAVSTSTNSLAADPDDSWATNSSVAVRENPGSDSLCQLPGGIQVVWKAHPSAHPNQNAALQFEIRDASGQPVRLDPYMGMLSHAAVLRSDGRVFAHLHPTGNFSMAAQMLFDAKLAKETGADSSMAGMDMSGMDHSMMGQTKPATSGGPTVLSLPYEFPTPGDYRIWVQIKVAGQVMTAIFDTTVSPA